MGNLSPISEGISPAGNTLSPPGDSTLPFKKCVLVDVTKDPTMVRPRRWLPRALTSMTRGQRRIVAIAVFALTLVLVNYIRTPAKSYRNELDAEPHFTYLAPFRKNPDLAYEATIEEALHDIERRVLESEAQSGAQSEGQVRRIWQIKLGDIKRRSESVAFEKKNGNWEYTLVNDEWAEDFIMNTFASIPDIIASYESYPRVVRADLLRYLLAWYHGGYYADLDVRPVNGIDSCYPLRPLLFPEEPNRMNISLVLGVELDEPYASAKRMHHWHWSRTYGFIQYNLYAPRRFSPFLRQVIVRVLAHTKRHQRSGWNWLLGTKYPEKTVHEISGPGVFSDTILDVLSDMLPLTHHLVRSSREADGVGAPTPTKAEGQNRVTWAPFHGLKQPLWVDATEAKAGKDMGGLGVLPINVWGNGQRHSGAENFHSRHACINHRFAGTWKNKGWKAWFRSRFWK